MMLICHGNYFSFVLVCSINDLNCIINGCVSAHRLAVRPLQYFQEIFQRSYSLGALVFCMCFGCWCGVRGSLQRVERMQFWHNYSYLPLSLFKSLNIFPFFIPCNTKGDTCRDRNNLNLEFEFEFLFLNSLLNLLYLFFSRFYLISHC